MSLSSERIHQILDGMTDPLNRVYRYPICHWLLKWTIKWPITPNQVTVFHTLFSFVGAAFLSQGYLWMAFVIYEIRAVLDCFDGVLARGKQLYSPYGRSIDALGDFIAFVGMMIGSAVYLIRSHPNVTVLNTIGPVLLVIMFMAAAYDFFKRKISSALKSGQDEVAEQLIAGSKKIHAGQASLVAQITYVADWIQICIFAPQSVGKMLELVHTSDRLEGAPQSFATDEMSRIAQRVETPVFTRLIKVISLVAGDNGLTILNLGLLTGFYVSALRLTMIYGILVIVIAVVLYQRALYEEKMG